ncbi:MAG: hypothetical protein KBS66_05220 [Eubacterium sp.]|nr:hypothetical protein [Candidatus Colimonas fimequi]
MENLNIAIVTDDKEYGRAAGLAILNVCRSLVINIFSKEEFAAAGEKYTYASDSGRVFSGFDLILWEGAGSEQVISPVLVQLVDKPSLTFAPAEGERYRIYKYSPAQRMVSDIFEIYGRITGRRPVNIMRRGVHLLGFASSVGGAGCTTLAMAVAQEMSRFHDKRVFYISLEELESTGEFIKTHVGMRTLSYYLYNLFKDRKMKGLIVRDGNHQFRPFMESYVIRDDFGVEAFQPTKGRNPLVDISSEEICVFIESIMNCGRYDVIIVDTGCGLSEAAVTCLEMAEKITYVTGPGNHVQRETNSIQYLMCVAGEDMARKMIKVVNKSKNSAMEAFFAGDDAGRCDIVDTALEIEETVVSVRENQVTKILLDGAFGQSINTLTEKIIEPLK